MEINGFAIINDKKIPFHFENNKVNLYFEVDENTPRSAISYSKLPYDDEIKDEDFFICCQVHGMIAGGWYLFHLECPLFNSDKEPFPHSVTRRVDWMISSFTSDSLYKEMRFRFDELSFFIPACYSFMDDDSYYKVPKESKNISEFDILIDNNTVKIQLTHYSTRSSGITSSASIRPEMRILFDETKDYSFIYKVYRIVEDIFAFICNRRNIALRSVELCGEYEFNNEKHPFSSILTVYDKYKEPFETDEIISKTSQYNLWSSHFDILFQLIADNRCKEKGTISINEIHPSTLRRNRIDLSNSLRITSAFEHNFRRYLPEISSDATLEVYSDIRDLIEKYASTVSGKKRKKTKEILDNLDPMISLEDKIKKTIIGYKDWKPLKSVIEERFNDWEQLANVVNIWRNELAHEKREYVPSKDTIRAVRLVEHLNYCIVLRIAGYSDDEIKLIIQKVLIV